MLEFGFGNGVDDRKRLHGREREREIWTACLDYKIIFLRQQERESHRERESGQRCRINFKIIKRLFTKLKLL